VAGGTSAWKRTIPADDIGVTLALTLLRDLRYEGLAEVEYQVGDDCVPRLMEIGPRSHGWLSLACAAGVDLPLIAAQTLIGQAALEARPYLPASRCGGPRGSLPVFATQSAGLIDYGRGFLAFKWSRAVGRHAGRACCMTISIGTILGRGSRSDCPASSARPAVKLRRECARPVTTGRGRLQA